MSKSIVCYFSASGVTKNVAERISLIINGDLFEIQPLDKYTDKDLNWHDTKSRSSIEMSDSSCRVALKEKLKNVDDYDVIIIGYPIWWDLAPRIINTFIESINLAEKKVYLFATSGGSRIDNSVAVLKREYPNINIISGKLLSKYTPNEEIKNWLN